MTYLDAELDEFAKDIKADFIINRANGNRKPYIVMCARIDNDCLEKLVNLLEAKGMKVTIHEPGTPIDDETLPSADNRFMLLDQMVKACK